MWGYVYGLEACDFRAVFEAYLAGRWWLFNATRQANLDSLVRIGVGRDTVEIAFAMPYGNMEPTGMRIWIEEAQDRDEPTPRTTDAISTEEPAPTRAQAEGLLPNNAAESAKKRLSRSLVRAARPLWTNKGA